MSDHQNRQIYDSHDKETLKLGLFPNLLRPLFPPPPHQIAIPINASTPIVLSSSIPESPLIFVRNFPGRRPVVVVVPQGMRLVVVERLED
ncbi:unnamed protein product [Linum trigynum]|uniref:Uncharacterized protein n=1 Tax=Linum trigynum TaxID=586398 RepID=A0AAV2ESK2_9ROSI